MKRDPKAKAKAYSLGRCQMAWWFFLIVAAFMVIAMVTHSSDVLNSTALSLMGISAGTMLGAAAVDSTLNAGKDAPPPTESAGWLADILSDAQGNAFHRFQMVVWTVVLSVLFVVSVWRRLAMPDFSGTLLAMMGISSGTYVGFKFQENTK